MSAIPASQPRVEVGAGAPAKSLLAEVEAEIRDALRALKARQQPDGHWVYELEADATIPAEFIMLEHYLDDIDDEVERKLAVYLRSIQGAHGGWPLFHDGDFDISASVKAYFALKLAGDDVSAPHMQRARDAILAHGGAERSNCFTRIALALFGAVPWRAVPVMPVEIMHLPRWFPFHLDKVSYWTRTVLVPLLVLMALKPRARNPRGVGIDEIFREPPSLVRRYITNHTGSIWGGVFVGIDSVLRRIEPWFPVAPRKRAIEKAMAFVETRLNGEDGLGAIYPAMANTVMAYDALGYGPDHPQRAVAMKAIRKLLVLGERSGYCQPCVSPIWDTSLVAHTLLEVGEDKDSPALRASLEWLVERQVTEVVGDWAAKRPGLRPGGWAFQYANDFYPDVDDTAVVGMALDRARDPKYAESIRRAAEWVVGMQSADGGWGAFDADNTAFHLNHIPFSDHGALLDPPTADVSARCIGFLCQIGYKRDHQAVARGIEYLRREQEEDGSWFGRWGTNYVYGTWSVLNALNAAGEDMNAAYVRKSVEWLVSRQNADGGWGEDGATYWKERRGACKGSTPSQTAWAVLGLMAAGEVNHLAVRRGIEYLLKAPRQGDRWDEQFYTAVGFPRVFYLRYHGYAAYFPLWALARFRNLMTGNARQPLWGM